MRDLLDHLFNNLKIETLNREQAEEYLCYLKDILPQISSREEKVKFYASSVKLNQRLVEIDQKTIRDLNVEISVARDKVHQQLYTITAA